MSSLKQVVINDLKLALELAFPTATSPIEVTLATQEKFGHYQCNSAMRLAKELAISPREVASLLVEKLDKAHYATVEIAGPGFINLTFKEDFLSDLLTAVLKDKRLGVPLPTKKEKIIVEFSSPNVAKEMHVGHLRSTIIGDAIARLFEFLGHDVLRLNHIGDWGTAFGMLIAYMQETVPEVLEGSVKTDLPTLMGWYKASKKKFDEDEAFKLKSRQQVVALQGGDKEALKGWTMICEISRIAYNEVYAVLDVKLNERGESFYNPMLPSVIDDLEKKGLITISEGAKCVFHEGYAIPLMVQKSDGGYNYDTTDMAAMRQRIDEEKADRIIIVTDVGQSLHFQLIDATCIQAGYRDPSKVRFDHVTFGVVLGADGKKFKTRSGDTEKLVDLLTAAVKESEKILAERGGDMTPTEVKELALILGIDAVKYADLSGNRSSDYLFSYERMLKFEGNTAAFILYAFVRVNGIKRKIGVTDISELMQSGKITLSHPSEVQLAVQLLRFSDLLTLYAADLLPHYLTDYLYTLATKFNIFFRDCRVEGSENQESRLLLCELTARTMEIGLQLLGLKTVERM